MLLKKTNVSMRKSKGKYKNTWKKMIMKTQSFKNLSGATKAVLSGKFITIYRPSSKKRSKISNQQLKLSHKRIRKRRTNKT